MYLALIAAVVRVCLDLHLWLMGLEVSLRDRARGAAFIGALWGNITSVALRWFHRLLFIGAWAVPLGATAWAWGQERIPGARHELGATALTANQILTAKALVWLVPLALYGALRVTGTVASDLIVVTATPPDSLAARFAEEIYTEI